MSYWEKIRGLVRFGLKLHGFLDETLSLDEAKRRIETGVSSRCENFLYKLKSAVLHNPRSPYRILLEAAGCEFGDIERLVEKEGLDGSLRILAESGVYLSYDEFKCRIPTIRGSQTFVFQEQDFNDPLIEGQLFSTSGGSRSKPVRIPEDVNHISLMAQHWAVFLAENDGFAGPLLFWTPGHAAVASRQLACAKCNKTFQHWFVSEQMTSTKDRLYAACINGLARRTAGFPRPKIVPFSEPNVILACLFDLLRAGKKVCLNTAPSAAVKLSAAAMDKNRYLSGVSFLLGAEPLTSAHRHTIEMSGARAIPLYGSSEAPWIGGQCRHPEWPDEVHLLLDGYAVILDPADMSNEDGQGNRLLLTSLHHASPKVLLNTDIGDRGILTTRRCDCLYDRLGCRVSLHRIRSSEKITAFGVTIAVSDVYYVLNEIFPKRFGGTAGDYQLVETHDPQGQPRYTLLVAPDLPSLEERALPAAFLSELGKIRASYGFMVTTWSRENLIRVRRSKPIRTFRGKVLAFYRVGDIELKV